MCLMPQLVDLLSWLAMLPKPRRPTPARVSKSKSPSLNARGVFGLCRLFRSEGTQIEQGFPANWLVSNVHEAPSICARLCGEAKNLEGDDTRFR